MSVQPENLAGVEKMINIKTTQKKKPQPERPPLEFKKGRVRSKSEKSDPKRITRRRIMITFENEPSYRFLLNDQEELQKLNPTSYLDLDFLEKEKKYRVHLYYRNGKKTRITHWESKYPNIRKFVDPDEPMIRTKFDADNTLSKAIDEALKLSCIQEDPKHDKPPTPPDDTEAKKKLKISPTLALPKNQKAKSQLLIELNNLKVALKLTSGDLQERTQENLKLHKDLDQTKNKMQALLNQQEILKNVFQKVIEKLPPASKADLKDILSKHGLDLENKPLTESAEDFESPKSRVFSHIDVEQNEEEKSLREEEAKEFDIQSHKSRAFSNEEVDHTGRNDLADQRLVLEMEELFGGYDEDKNLPIEKSRKSSSSEISFICTDDDKAVSLEEKISQELLSNEQKSKVNPQRAKNSSQKKPQPLKKKIWSDLNPSVIDIFERIKLKTRTGIKLEALRNDHTTTPNSWQKILKDKELYAKLLAYINE